MADLASHCCTGQGYIDNRPTARDLYQLLFCAIVGCLPDVYSFHGQSSFLSAGNMDQIPADADNKAPYPATRRFTAVFSPATISPGHWGDACGCDS
jgi:hypothetical protein